MFNTKGLAGAMIALVFMAAPAIGSQSVDLSNPAFAPVSGPTSIPVGAAEFCKSHRDECGPFSGAVELETLSETNWSQLIDINAAVNAAIVPETDEDLYKVAEYWTYPDGRGDCEDIALEKRRLLIEAGWAPSTLLMTVVRQRNGDGHAVLMVRTDRGDLVLDNQNGSIVLWNDTPYQYIKRQSQTDSGKWVGLEDNRATIVAVNR